MRLLEGRLALRGFARRQLRRGDLTEDQRAALQAVLTNRDLREAVADEKVAEYESAIIVAGAGSPLTDFFEWLLAHADEIIALIMKLLPLFV